MAPEQKSITVLEEKLIDAIRFGKTLDMSLEPDPVLPSVALRKVLKTVEPHSHGLRVRGAFLEEGLDLRGIRAKFPLSFIECTTPSVRLDSDRLDSEAVREITLIRLRLVPSQEDTIAYYLRRARGAVPTSMAVTSLLFAFLAVKVLWVAHGDVPTALGVFGSSPPTTVIVGGLLSGISVVAAAGLGISSYFLFAGVGLSKRARISYLLATTIACVFLTPWKIAAVSAAAGFLAGILVRYAARSKPKDGARRHTVARRIAFALGMVAVVLILPGLMDAVWLPHEALTVTSTPDMPEVGYVLDDADGWLTLLHTGDRHIKRIPGENVLKRAVCQPGQAPAGTWPFLWTPTTLGTEMASLADSRSQPIGLCP